MKVDYSERAGRTLDGVTPQLRRAVYKQVKLLEQNLRHPSAPSEEIRRITEHLAGPRQ